MCQSLAAGGQRCTGKTLSLDDHYIRASRRRARDRARKEVRARREIHRTARNFVHAMAERAAGRWHATFELLPLASTPTEQAGTISSAYLAEVRDRVQRREDEVAWELAEDMELRRRCIRDEPHLEHASMEWLLWRAHQPIETAVNEPAHSAEAAGVIPVPKLSASTAKERAKFVCRVAALLRPRYVNSIRNTHAYTLITLRDRGVDTDAVDAVITTAFDRAITCADALLPATNEFRMRTAPDSRLVASETAAGLLSAGHEALNHWIEQQEQQLGEAG